MTPSDALTPIDANDVRWRNHLAALPDAAPSDALWLRLQQAHADRFAPRRAARWPWLASAAALVVAVVATQLVPPAPTAPHSPLSAAPAPVATLADIDPAGRANLLRIDAALERAYEHDAGDAELQALWQARSGVVDALATAAPAQLLQL